MIATLKHQPVSRETFEPRDPRMKMGRELVEDYRYGDLLVPAGFEWDGATIPRAFWTLVGGPYHPQIMAASLLHDWLYWTRAWKREDADKLLRHVMKEAGAPEIRADLVYGAVRGFGGFYFGRTKTDVEYARVFTAWMIMDGKNPNDYHMLRFFPELAKGL